MIEFACGCEMKAHRAPVEGYEISSGALQKLPEILREYRNIYMIADTNTYAAAGETAEKILRAAGKAVRVLVLDGEVILPNELTLGKILLNAHDPAAKSDIMRYSPLPDFMLAVGSGTVNDSTRIVSYRLGIPYGVVATAPSMDGYLSAGSPIVFGGTKKTVQATTPKYLIADLDILTKAPYRMMQAGIGDMFGKYTGMLDWELARDYTGEYYCEKIGSDVIAAADSCLKNGYRLAERDPECVKSIMEGFLVTGLGMAFTGNSRPASGSEHIVAHSWELYDIEEGRRPNLHGLEVCEATLVIGLMYKRLYRETEDAHLRELIGRYIPYLDAVEKFCRETQMPMVVTTEEEILRGIRRALGLRDRYTVLFYLRDHGLFEEYAVWTAKEMMRFVG